MKAVVYRKCYMWPSDKQLGRECVKYNLVCNKALDKNI